MSSLRDSSRGTIAMEGAGENIRGLATLLVIKNETVRKVIADYLRLASSELIEGDDAMHALQFDLLICDSEKMEPDLLEYLLQMKGALKIIILEPSTKLPNTPSAYKKSVQYVTLPVTEFSFRKALDELLSL